MSATEAMRAAETNGIRLEVEGRHLLLAADLAPPVEVVNAIRRHKAEIIELLGIAGDGWTAEDWHAFFEKRADIAEFNGGQTRNDADAFAFECCIIEWLNRHPEPSDPDHCAWCGNADSNQHAIVPFGTENYGHTWLHPECWNKWHEIRLDKARRALAAMGLHGPPNGAGGPKFPDDFGKNGGA